MSGGLPDGWVDAIDPASGVTYYYHGETETTTWDHPGGEIDDPKKSRSTIQGGLDVDNVTCDVVDESGINSAESVIRTPELAVEPAGVAVSVRVLALISL